jgi:FMNH2-dependent dimethyl sulfone monooxygenase
MRWGIWTPLPHTIQPEPAMVEAEQALKRHGEGSEDASLRFALDLVRRAEDYGFDLTLVAERFLGPDLEAWMLSAALAAHTRRIEIMPAVHPGILAPQVVAKMAATLDRISAGRCALNLVNGWWKEEFDLYSNGAWIDKEETRYARMDEFIAVLKGLWTEDSYSHAGRFYRADRGSLPTKSWRRPHPPLYTGSRSPAAKDIVARQCDAWFVSVEPGYRNWEKNLATIAADISDMRARAGTYGRAIGYGMSCHVICADSEAQAHADADALEDYGRRDRVAAVAAKALGPGLVGTPEIIADRIRRYEAAGVDCLMLHFHPMMQGLETFAERVMPILGVGRRAHEPEQREMSREGI